MAVQVTYDDSQLTAMLKELDFKYQKKAVQGGIRRELTRIRRTAVNNLRASGLRTDIDVIRGVRAHTFKKTIGGEVTVKPRKYHETDYHLNRYGRRKPVLMWAEGGTAVRFTQPKQGTRKRASRLRESHTTGRMRRYGFMEKTERQVAGTVEREMEDEIRKNIVRVVKKHGGHE